MITDINYLEKVSCIWTDVSFTVSTQSWVKVLSYFYQLQWVLGHPHRCRLRKVPKEVRWSISQSVRIVMRISVITTRSNGKKHRSCSVFHTANWSCRMVNQDHQFHNTSQSFNTNLAFCSLDSSSEHILMSSDELESCTDKNFMSFNKSKCRVLVQFNHFSLGDGLYMCAHHKCCTSNCSPRLPMPNMPMLPIASKQEKSKMNSYPLQNWTPWPTVNCPAAATVYNNVLSTLFFS